VFAPVQLSTTRRLTDEEIDQVTRLLAAAGHDGRRAFRERDWAGAARARSADFWAVIARGKTRAVPVGYAEVLRERDAWSVEYAVDRSAAGAAEIGPALLRQALATVAEEGGGRVQVWRSSPTAESDADARSVGLDRTRDVLQLRCALPVDQAWSLAVRPFVVGRDEDAWLEVNNRAFEWHPEQSGWDRATIAAHEREPWFDPAGFLLHEEDGRLAGFCWTKIHAAEQPPMGEIYVIAVDPEFGGRGLGRQLTLAGLDHLARAGLGVGMLYVESDNQPARALYDRIGFTIDHIDRAYTGDIPPATG
jgi:mycothiol synthase